MWVPFGFELGNLPGHPGIKTTDIYTHSSNANILSIKSPIEKLGLLNVPVMKIIG
ncbi:hypothetical protein LCGC14_1844580 [marine sediment metagenome]|uniref:Uncharacterized protein n=1 Tax=marine sediment metagenome TaxID=412755 RepID=A0A0F9JBH9_9ZZZZ